MVEGDYTAMTTKKKMPKNPVGNLVKPKNEIPPNDPVAAYQDSMAGFANYVWTGHFRKRNERQTK